VICCIPRCDRQAHDLLEHPLCPPHARSIYFEVKDLVEASAATVRASKPSPVRALTLRNQADQPGHVYFMLMGEGVVKIGFSTNVQARARQVGATEVLATTPGTRRLERALHAKFGPHWIEGEYFADCGEIRSYIGKIKEAS
jgi:hypothetical protein